MQDLYLSDFYRGWSIEVTKQEQGFVITCYSPARQRLSDGSAYPHDFQALRAAKQVINHHLGCLSIANVIRELYELDKLSFQEWRSLQHSIFSSGCSDGYK
jgi:hypothetical protein